MLFLLYYIEGFSSVALIAFLLDRFGSPFVFKSTSTYPYRPSTEYERERYDREKKKRRAEHAAHFAKYPEILQSARAQRSA